MYQDFHISTPMTVGCKAIEKIYENTKGNNIGATDVELEQWQKEKKKKKTHRSSHFLTW